MREKKGAQRFEEVGQGPRALLGGLQRGSGVWSVSTPSSHSAVAPTHPCSPGGARLTAAGGRDGDCRQPSAVPAHSGGASRLKEPLWEGEKGRERFWLAIYLQYTSDVKPLEDTNCGMSYDDKVFPEPRLEERCQCG